MQIDATYSPEDNKLRLYPSARLDQETFERVKAAGFKWAPRQELFVAPKWTPEREDLCVDLAGEIEAEEMTLAERAEMKAERLDALAAKRAQQASAYSARASELSEAFYMGQPILVGHHSERKARKTQERMRAAQSKAVDASRAVGYWMYRAEGVEHHANYKNRPDVRARRIKTLLSELRSLQSDINDAHTRLGKLRKIEAVEDDETRAKFIRMAVGSGACSIDFYFNVDKGEIALDDALRQMIEGAKLTINGPKRARWITHTLNRLAFEREMLGPVPRFGGDLTPAVLQVFLRTHGADKPKAKHVGDDIWTVELTAPAPLHIGDGCTLEMNGDEWRDLMQNLGYEVPQTKTIAQKAPLLNFDSPTGWLTVKSRATYRGADPVDRLPVILVSKAQLSAMRSDIKGTRLLPCGEYRVRYGKDPEDKRGYNARWGVLFITDQKAHPAPDSADFTAAQQEGAA